MRVTSDLTRILKSITSSISETSESSVARGGDDPYTAADAARDIKLWHGIAKECAQTLERTIEAAIKRIPSWTGSDVTLKFSPGAEGAIDWFSGDEPRLNVSVDALVGGGTDGPGFTVFCTEDGTVRGIDDVLDAGDTDFFHDPLIEADYFSLTEELRHPGRAKSDANKVVTLYTARPLKDRSLYERASSMPNNIFLTTDPDEAWGYSVDLGGDRDIWKVRIKRQYLVQTLDSGRHKNYQTFTQHGKTPVEDIELIQAGDSKTASRDSGETLVKTHDSMTYDMRTAALRNPSLAGLKAEIDRVVALLGEGDLGAAVKAYNALRTILLGYRSTRTRADFLFRTPDKLRSELDRLLLEWQKRQNIEEQAQGVKPDVVKLLEHLKAAQVLRMKLLRDPGSSSFKPWIEDLELSEVVEILEHSLKHYL